MRVLWLPEAMAFVAALLAMFLLLRSNILRGVVDHPNERSLHVVPIPRTGGLALMAGTLTGWGLIWQPLFFWIAAAVMFLMLVSFLDDVHGLSAGWRFLMHFIVASIFVLCTIFPATGWLLAIVVTIATVWMINLYNFMDGSDGLAGGMALFGFSTYGIAAWLAGNIDMMAVCLCISASAIAFLLFNFHPAKIFMGDAGSIPLGFLSASLGLLGWQQGIWPLWFPILVFSPFICDATATLLKRLMRGEKIWQAHRTHYYQRMVRIGWGHRKTAYAEYSLMMMTGGSAILLIGQPTSIQLGSLILWILLYIALAMKIDRLSDKLLPKI